MTTIRASEYSPNSPATPLTPLKPGQVTLLNKGAANDISQRVRTIVQTHLGYQGTETFRTTFTKKEVTFTLRDGPATEKRTLKLVNGHWMLSQNSTTPAAPLDPTVEAEVNTLINEILASIGKASRANVSDPAHTHPTATLDAVDGKVSSADDSELAQIKVKLASLENQLRTNLTLEQSLEVQRQILEQLIGLRSALEKNPHANSTEKDKLQKQVKKLQKALAKKEEEFQRLIRDAKAQLESMQVGFESEKTKFQQAWESKNRQALELQQNVDDLKKALVEKGAEHKKALEKFESSQKQINAQCEKIEQAAKENASNQEHTALAFKTQQFKLLDEKDSLEQQLETARSTLDDTAKQLNTEKEELQRQVDELQKALKEKEAELKNSATKFDTKQTEFNEQQSKFLTEKDSLEKQLQDVQSTLNTTAKQLKAEKEDLQRRVEEIQKALKEKEAELKSFTRNAQAEFERLQEGFKAEKEKFQERQKALQDQYDKLESQFKIETTFSNFLSNESIPALQKSLNEKDQKLKTATQAAEENESQLQSELKKVNQTLEKSEEARFNIVAVNNAKVEKMRNIIVQIDQQTTDLTSKLEAARTENYTFTQNNQDLQESLQEKKRLLEQSENDAALMEKRIAKLERENEHLNLVIENAEQEKKLEPAQSDRDVTRKQLELLENNVQYLQALEQLQGTDENGILSKENSSQQEKTATLDQETLPTQNPVLASLQELAKTTDEDSKRTIEELQTSFQEKYQKMLWAELENLPDEAAIPSTENSNLIEKSSSAERAVEMKVQEIASLSEQLEQAKQIQATLQNTIKGLQSELAQVTDEAKNISLEATKNESKLRDDLKEYEEIFADTKAELTKAQDNNTALTNQLESAHKLNALALERIQTFEKSLNEKDQQLEIATLQQEFLHGKIEEYKADRSDAEQLATEATSAWREAEKQKSQMQTELKELDMLLAEQELKTGQIEFDLEQATEMQETLQDQNTNLISKLESAEKAGEDSTLTIQELQESLRKKEGQLKDIKIELDEAHLDTEEAKVDATIALDKVNNAFLEAQRKIESLEEERRQLEAANNQAQREISYLLPRVNDELDIEQQQTLLKNKIENNRS
jgi:chromosome segregation ATPase